MNLKKIGKLFMSKFVGTGPSSYKNRIYRAAVSQRVRNKDLVNVTVAGEAGGEDRSGTVWYTNKFRRNMLCQSSGSAPRRPVPLTSYTASRSRTL
jgi:hypothetical protein